MPTRCSSAAASRAAAAVLLELDLASNRLVAVPPLAELPLLQVLKLQKNQIARNWGELSSTSQSLRELDVSQNRLAWQQPTGEFDAAMGVLASLKKLKELKLGGNPVSDTPALRYLVLSYSPKLTRLDNVPVNDNERRGKPLSGAGVMGREAAIMQAAVMVPPGAGSDDDDDILAATNKYQRAIRDESSSSSSHQFGIPGREGYLSSHVPIGGVPTQRSLDAAAGINIEALTERNKQPQQVAVEDDDDDDDDGAGVGFRRGQTVSTLDSPSSRPWGGGGGEAYLLSGKPRIKQGYNPESSSRGTPPRGGGGGGGSAEGVERMRAVRDERQLCRLTGWW